MNDTFYARLEHILTKPRLSVYQQDGADDTTALARYLYNIELCRALYTPLHIFEVSLRNAIDDALQAFLGIADWYDALPFDSIAKGKIAAAKDKITKKGRSATHDRIIAELTLGFWTSLFTARYSRYGFQSYIIKRCFSRCPRSQRSAKSLQKTFDKIRLVRNRVSHYERIIGEKDLSAQHDQLLECIRWIDESAYALVAEADRFVDIHAAGLSPFVALVRERWN